MFKVIKLTLIMFSLNDSVLQIIIIIVNVLNEFTTPIFSFITFFFISKRGGYGHGLYPGAALDNHSA